MTRRAVAGGAQHQLARLFAPLEPLVDLHLVVGEDGDLVRWARDRSVPVQVVRHDDLAEALEGVAPEVVWSEGADGHCWAGPVAAEQGRGAVWWRSLTLGDRPADHRSATIPADAIACTTATACRRQRARTPGTRVVCIPAPLAAHHLTDDPCPPGPTARRPTSTDAPVTGRGAPVIGMVGRIDRVKGIGTFLDAAALVARRRPDLRVVVAGGAIVGHEGALEATLRARAERPDLAGRVTFTGHLEDPDPVLRQLDVLVSASLEESFGLSVLEALAAGVPVVATATEGPSELLGGGRFGRLVPIGDVDALAAGITATLDEPTASRAMAAAGRERARTHRPEVIARRWAALLRGVARRRSASAGSSGGSVAPRGRAATARSGRPA